MELRQLECFVACCEHGTFTAAARSLNLVQSAVSTSVAKLERELGTRLFDRTPTTLRLTPAGAAALGPARSALSARERVRDAVEGSLGTLTGTVVVGALVNVLNFDLAGAFARVHRRHPQIAIAMRQHRRGTADNVRGVLDGTLDLALGGFDSAPPGVVVEPLVEEPLVLVTAPEHPLAGDVFSPADLTHERFIDFPPGWGIRSVVDRVIPVRQSVIEVADQEFAVRLAARGFGVALVPRSLLDSGTRRTAVATCTDPSLLWHMGVAHSAKITPSNAARAVLDALIEMRRL